MPSIGEIIGGSERETNLDKIKEALNINFKDNEYEKAKYNWYLELREFGCHPHSGLGVGFDRLMMLITGMKDIKDVIPYPRYPNHAEF